MSSYDLFSWAMAIAALQEKNVSLRAIFPMDITATRQKAAEHPHPSIQARKSGYISWQKPLLVLKYLL